LLSIVLNSICSRQYWALRSIWICSTACLGSICARTRGSFLWSTCWSSLGRSYYLRLVRASFCTCNPLSDLNWSRIILGGNILCYRLTLTCLWTDDPTTFKKNNLLYRSISKAIHYALGINIFSANYSTIWIMKICLQTRAAASIS